MAGIVRLCLVVVAAVLIASCASQNRAAAPFNKLYRLGKVYNAPPHYENEAIVVVGVKRLSAKGFSYAIGRVEGDRIDGRGEATWAWGCCKQDSDYHIYRLPPGTYAGLYFSNEEGQYLMVNAARVYLIYKGSGFSKIDLIDPKPNLETPRFTVGPNEVLYVGDLVGDFTDPGKPRFSIESSEDGARAALAEIEETRPLSVRPWQRQSGPGPRPLHAASRDR